MRSTVHSVLFYGREKTFITSPVTDWSNLGSYIKRHVKSTDSSHHVCVTKACHFLDVRAGKMASICSAVSETHKIQVEQNRHIIKKIIEVLVLCGKQNIPIRGHTEERSNFLAILESKSNGDAILMEHLKSATNVRARYTSPDIQNELLSICAEQIQSNIIKACNDALCFALIADESTDQSTKEQVSICLRYLEKNVAAGKCKVREDFLCFVTADRTTGDELATILLSALERHGIDVDKMRAQGYDGAANMSGKARGVQTRIRQRVPGAAYVHCKAHCLNLAIMHACKDPCV